MSDADTDIVIEPEDDGASEKADAKVKKIKDELKRVTEERDEYLAGWQRSKADYVNLSRRVREQEEQLVKTSTAKVARSVITVFDSLEAAYGVAKQEGGALVGGLEQVIKQLEQALKDNGAHRFTPEPGDTFDPSRHEPIQTVATEVESEDNTVSETFQSGYEVSGMVVRPARVSVKRFQI